MSIWLVTAYSLLAESITHLTRITAKSTLRRPNILCSLDLAVLVTIIEPTCFYTTVSLIQPFLVVMYREERKGRYSLRVTSISVNLNSMQTKRREQNDHTTHLKHGRLQETCRKDAIQCRKGRKQPLCRFDLARHDRAWV